MKINVTQVYRCTFVSIILFHLKLLTNPSDYFRYRFFQRFNSIAMQKRHYSKTYNELTLLGNNIFYIHTYEDRLYINGIVVGESIEEKYENPDTILFFHIIFFEIHFSRRLGLLVFLEMSAEYD